MVYKEVFGNIPNGAGELCAPAQDTLFGSKEGVETAGACVPLDPGGRYPPNKSLFIKHLL